MIIRKLFKFESAHIVRNCSSKKCRENIHGHSYIVEVFLSSDHLDDGYMVMDFSRLGKVKEFIESFDHSYIVWNKEEQDFKDFIYKYNQRVVETPVSPSAEGFALMFLYVIDKILKSMRPVNGEKGVKLASVRVHETMTGYAEAFREDLGLVDFQIKDIIFSKEIEESWQQCWREISSTFQA